MPVIACTGSEPMNYTYGTNYRPKLEIAKWIDRPAELPDASPVEASEIWHGAPATASKPQATHLPPPAPAPDPVPAADPMLEPEF